MLKLIHITYRRYQQFLAVIILIIFHAYPFMNTILGNEQAVSGISKHLILSIHIQQYILKMSSTYFTTTT